MKKIKKIIAIISVVLMLGVTIYQVGAIGEYSEYPDSFTIASAGEADVGDGGGEYSPINEVDVSNGSEVDVLSGEEINPDSNLNLGHFEEEDLLDEGDNLGYDGLVLAEAEGGFQGIAPLFDLPIALPIRARCYYTNNFLTPQPNVGVSWVTNPPSDFSVSFALTGAPAPPPGWSFEGALIRYQVVGGGAEVLHPMRQDGNMVVYNFPFDFGQGALDAWNQVPVLYVLWRPAHPPIVKFSAPVPPATLPLLVGEVVEYGIRVNNPAANPIIYRNLQGVWPFTTFDGFRVVDTLPRELELVPGSVMVFGGTEVEDNSAGNVIDVTFNLPGSNEGGNPVVIVFQATVTSYALLVDEIINFADLYNPNTEEPIRDREVVRLGNPPTLEKDVIYIDGDAYEGQPVVHDDIVTYRLRVNNPNDRPLNNFLVTDDLPPGLELVGLEQVIPATAYVEDQSVGDVLNVVLNLPPGYTDVIFNVRVADERLAVNDRFVNVAYLYGPPFPDSVERPQVDECTATIRLPDPPTLEKDVIYIDDYAYVGQPVAQDDIVTYRLRVNNPNARTLNNFLVTDALPPGLELVGLEEVIPATAFVVDQSAGDVLRVVLNLPSGDTDVIFTVRVADENLAVNDIFINVAYLYGAPPADGEDRPQVDDCTATIRLTYPPTLEKDVIYIGDDDYVGQPVAQGDIVTYRLRVYNPNARAINNFLVTDTLPPGLALVDLEQVVPATAFVEDQSAGDVLSVILNLPPGDTDVIFTVRVADVSLAVNDRFVNVAYLYGPPINGEDRPQVDDCTATIRVIDPPTLDKEVIYIDDDAYVGQPVVQGDIVTYRLRVNNPNARTINDFLVTDALPPGLALIGLEQVIPATAYVEDQSAGDVLSVILNLPPGDTDVIFTVRVADVSQAVNDRFINVAYLYGPPPADNGERPQIDDCTATIRVIVPPTLEKDVIYIAGDAYVGQPVVQGDIVTYRLRVSNSNVRTINNFLVTDALPPGLALVGLEQVIPTTAFVADQSVGDVLSVILNLPPGDTDVIFVVRVADVRQAIDDRFVNVAYLYAPPTTDGGDDRPQIDDCRATITLADPPTLDKEIIYIDGDVYTGQPTAEGEIVTYRLRVNNPNERIINNFLVRDALPPGLTLVDVEEVIPATALVADQSAGNVLSVILNLPPGDTYIIFTATVTDGSLAVNGRITNIAYLYAPPVTEGGDDRPQIDECTATVVLRPPAVSLEKRVSSAITQPGGVLTYTLVVRNTGGIALTNVVITDDLPVELTDPRNITFNPAGAGAGTFAGQVLTVTIPRIEVNAEVVIAFSVTVAGDVEDGDVIDNVADVTTDQNVTDDDDATTTVRIEDSDPRPDILLVKSVSSGIAAPGESLTYTIVARNTGDQALTNVVVRDELPALLTNPRNLIINPDEAGTGSIDGQLLLVTIPELRVGEAVTITFEVTVANNAAHNTTIRNIATVTTNQNVTDDDDANVTVRHPGGGGNGTPPPPPQVPQAPGGGGDAPATGDMGMSSSLLVGVFLSLSAIFTILAVESRKKRKKDKS